MHVAGPKSCNWNLGDAGLTGSVPEGRGSLIALFMLAEEPHKRPVPGVDAGN